MSLGKALDDQFSAIVNLALSFSGGPTYSWTARYAIDGTSKQFDIDYRYDGTTTWYHEKAAF